MYFYLKEPKGKKDTLILLKYFLSKKEGLFTFSTKLFIAPSDWDKTTKMAKAKRGRSDLGTINRKLQEYITFLEKTLTSFDLNKISPNKQNLKIAFLNEFKAENRVSGLVYLTDFADDFIEQAPNLTNRVTNTKYNKGNIREYNKTNDRLKEFEKYRKKRLRVDDVTIKVYDNLVDYLKEERGYFVNTIGAIIKNLKKFLKIAEDLGYTVHKDYKDSSFKVLREESISIALREDEIEQIFNYDFSKDKRLENCRDLAIIGLWTGLRVSDFLSLPEIKQEETFITVQPRKTKYSSGMKVVIPLHHHIKEVIRKRGMPRMISNSEFNKYIKEVCHAVGITEVVRGGLMNSETRRKETGMYPKYKLVSSHTCRRSFATNLYKMNFPSLSIMNITGHTTEKSFLTYIKVTPTEHAEKLLKHWKEYYGN